MPCVATVYIHFLDNVETKDFNFADSKVLDEYFDIQLQPSFSKPYCGS